MLVGKHVAALELTRRVERTDAVIGRTVLGTRRAAITQREELPLGEALMDQSAVAGIGNVWKSELCFNALIAAHGVGAGDDRTAQRAALGALVDVETAGVAGAAVLRAA